VTPELAAIAFGLASAALWGAGDFSGGLAARRTAVLGVIVVSHGIGLCLMVGLALLRAEPFPAPADLIWGCLSGLSGVMGVAALYRALAVGQMGIAAPVAAVFTAAVPVLVAFLTEGLPRPLQFIGFGLALAGVWFLARPERTAANRSQGLGLAVLAGLGFGVLFVGLAQVSQGAFFWPLAAARATSFSATLALASRRAWAPQRGTLGAVILAGILDVGGNAFYVLATQAGRLDIAAVLASLYPASTVALAWLLLKERVTRLQVLGVGAALVAIMCITAG
jgi:drug/metabolite transporter (DMT)-like permease